MISQYLQSIPGAEFIGIAFLLGAVALFIVIVIWAVRMDTSHLATMGRLPFDEADQAGKTSGRVEP